MLKFIMLNLLYAGFFLSIATAAQLDNNTCPVVPKATFQYASLNLTSSGKSRQLLCIYSLNNKTIQRKMGQFPLTCYFEGTELATYYNSARQNARVVCPQVPSHTS